MNAYVIYVDENTTTSNRWSMYTVPGVDSLANDDRIASLYSGRGEKDRQLIGVVRLSENVSVVLAAVPPQLGGFTEIPVQTPPPRPVINSVRPASGIPAGGTEVEVHGQNFLDATAVFFGTERAESFTVDASGTSILATNPAGQNSVHVTIVTPGGTSAMTEADQFEYVEPAQVEVVAVDPNTGLSTGGDSIEIDVRSKVLGAPQAVLFGSTPVSSISYLGPSGVDTQRLSVVTPPNRGDVHVTVVTQDGSSAPSSNNLFRYVEPPPPGPPAISAIDGTFGLVVGGETVRITGSDIGDASEVKFGTVAAESFAVRVTDQGAVVIDAISPCQSKGSVPETVTTRRGTSAIVSTGEFNYSLPKVLGTVSFGSRAVGAAGLPLAATIPLKISLTDLPKDLLVKPATGDPIKDFALKALFQSAGLGPQFTVGQFVAAYGDATLEYAIARVRLQRGDGRDFSITMGAVVASNVTVSVNFVPIAKGYRADLLHVSVGGISGSGSGFAGFAASLAGSVANMFTHFINGQLVVLLEGTGT
jgi:IPT/TIG domain